ncbi:MAG: HEAT repeat domain-containing protein [Pirellulales bacterium]|nr:HEAT repeat domain-containing protein [Pirellulales bacterium]
MGYRCCHLVRLLTAGLCALAAGFARADIYVLANGGQVRGELVNPGESPRKQFIVRTDQGATVTFDREQLKQIVPQSPAEAEYENIRPTFPDTIDGQWELAEWCLKNSLAKQRNLALERIIELNPDHKQARMALGYSFLDGKWMRRDQWHKEHGYVYYDGDWRLPQEIELMKSRREVEQAERTWFVNVRKWLKWLDDPGRAKEAEESLRGINDPAAVPALLQVLKNENNRELRSLVVQLLGRIYSPVAINGLVDYALGDADPEIRASCVDELAAKPHPDITAKFVPFLRNRDNAKVNRAALALGKMGDKTVVRPLIDSLVTTHSFQAGSANPNSMSAGFGSNGSGGLSMGSSARIVRRDIQNQQVLDALVALTRQNFEFDEVAWRTWQAAQNKAAKVNARRD